MRHNTRNSGICRSLALAALTTALVNDARAAAAAKPLTLQQSAGKTAASVQPVEEAPLPTSVFVVPKSPRDGRNPFFPGAAGEAPVAKPLAALPSRGIVLNGITSPPSATAMINGKTFEQGEAGDIKLPDGSRLAIQCMEIKASSAIILIRGERRELKLRDGL